MPSESSLPAPAPASPPPSWARVALCAGLVAGVLGSAALALGYYLEYPVRPPIHSWPVSITSILLAGALSGITLGLGICGGMVVAGRRGGRAVLEVFGAAAGGVVGSLLPSGFGVLGFGSLSKPYIGTGIAAFGVLVAALLLGTLLSLPAATGRVRAVSCGATLTCSLLASALVIIPFGVTIAGIVATAMPLPVIRQILTVFCGVSDDPAIALSALTLGLAVVFGALVGAFIGLASNLAALLRQSWALMSRR